MIKLIIVGILAFIAGALVFRNNSKKGEQIIGDIKDKVK